MQRCLNLLTIILMRSMTRNEKSTSGLVFLCFISDLASLDGHLEAALRHSAKAKDHIDKRSITCIIAIYI